MKQNSDISMPCKVEQEPVSDITDLGLPTRPLNSLRRHGISTTEQLTSWSPEDLQFEIQRLGPGGIKAIKAALERHGLSMAASRPHSTTTKGD